MNKFLKLQLFPGPCWSYWYSQKPLDSLLPLSTSLSFGWNCSNGQKSKWSVRLSHGGYTKVGVDSPKWICYFLEQWPLEWVNEQSIFPTYLNWDPPPPPPFQNEQVLLSSLIEHLPTSSEGFQLLLLSVYLTFLK